MQSAVVVVVAWAPTSIARHFISSPLVPANDASLPAQRTEAALKLPVLLVAAPLPALSKLTNWAGLSRQTREVSGLAAPSALELPEIVASRRVGIMIDLCCISDTALICIRVLIFGGQFKPGRRISLRPLNPLDSLDRLDLSRVCLIELAEADPQLLLSEGIVIHPFRS